MQGLLDSVRDLFPYAEQRLCARHVYANLRKKWRGMVYRKLFWKIAKSSNEVDFKKNVKEMEDVDKVAWEFWKEKTLNTSVGHSLNVEQNVIQLTTICSCGSWERLV